MCGRYTNTASRQDIEQRFGVVVPFDEGTRRYNVAPTETVAGIVLDKEGSRVARRLRWGLVPSWSKDPRQAYKMINARAETADTRSAFKSLLGRADRRVLLLADGFYEWLRSEDPKQPRQPFRFVVDDGEPFAFAGLWTPSKIDGEWVATATILTTGANRLVAPVHDRMPVILPDRGSEDAWLDPGLDAQGAKALCKPLSPDRMRVSPANPLVNKAGVEGAELLAAPVV